MAKITPEMKQVAEKSAGWALATATKEGYPNVVAIAFGKFLDDDKIMLVDVFMDKTKANIEANPNVAVAVWDMQELKGYQFKGKAHFEISGKLFEEGVQIVKSMLPQLDAKAVLVIDVEEVYDLTPGHTGKVV